LHEFGKRDFMPPKMARPRDQRVSSPNAARQVDPNDLGLAGGVDLGSRRRDRLYYVVHVGAGEV
jgi:hypothetical protein